MELEIRVTSSLDKRVQAKERLEKRLRARRAELAQARTAVKQLAVWQRESLDSDPQVARSRYQAWLLELVGA